jgi:hypothetical protein
VRLEQHLSGCSACRRELAELSSLEHLLADLAPVAPPPSLVTETLLRARHELRPVSRRRRIWAPAMTMASAAAVLLVFVGQFALRAPAPLVASGPAMLAATDVVAPVQVLAPHPTLPVVTRPPVAVEKRIMRQARPARVATRVMPARTAIPIPAKTPSVLMDVAAASAYQEAASLAKSDPDLTVVALENVALTYPKSKQATQALLAAAELERQRGHLGEADRTYRRVLALPSGSRLTQALAHKALGDMRRESVGDDELATYHYTQAARSLRAETEARQPRVRTQALVVLADVEKSLGQRDRAVADYAAAANSGLSSVTTDQTTTALAEVL